MENEMGDKFMKRQKIMSYIAGAMTVAVLFTGNQISAFAADSSTDNYKKVIEFEDANKFSSDNGNAIKNDQFKDYSGNGYVYLTCGWAEVNFDIPTDGKYKITIVTNSDQKKENWLYLDDNGVGKLTTEANKWTKTTNEYDLTKGSHKFGVSSDWGYTALDYVIIEAVENGNTGGNGDGDQGDTDQGNQGGQGGTIVDVKDEKTIEFEDANHFSSDSGNKVANDQFSGYSGSGYVYLTSGWSEVNVNIKDEGKYKITLRSNSDQDKENNVYLDNSSIGKLSTKANQWNESEYEVKLSAGEHKVGVSTEWGYVALDSVKIEKVADTVVDDPVETGSLYVKGTTLYDGKGNPFVMRGINIAHGWYTDKTEQSINAVAKLGANSVRVVLCDGSQWTKTSKEEVENIIKWCKAKGLVCTLEIHDYTGKNDPQNIKDAVNYWKDLKDLLNANKDFVIVNIANEWLGDWDQSSIWASTYCDAVKQLRDAGIENVLMVDAPGYGQQTAPAINDCQKVKEADTTGNIIFSIHMYSVAGKDESTVKSNIDSMISKDVCTCIGEFGDFQNGGDVDEKTIINYSNDKKVGTMAWSWKGNGGTDITLDLAKDWDGNELSDWGKYVFGSENGIQNTSKLAYTLKGYDGNKTEGGNGSDHTGDSSDDVVDIPDENAEINIKPGLLGSLTSNWYVSSKGDADKSETSTVTKLKNGGQRLTFDLSKDEYPCLVNMTEGAATDLSQNKTLSVVVRNNTRSTVQLQPIFKVGDEWEWTEYDKYQSIPGLTTVQLTFDLSKCATRDEVNAFLFRIQGGGSKAAGSIDFLSVTPDLDTDTYKSEIAELNRPKSASYFSWKYPEASWVDQTTSTECDDSGVLSVGFKNVTSENASGIQTETKPGLGVGLDCSQYKTLTCDITNDNAFDMSTSLLFRTSSNWTWQENAGVINGVEGGVIPAGKTVKATFNLQDSVWKSKVSNWQYTGELQDPDDLRALGFKMWANESSAVTGNLKISNLSFTFK